MDLFIKKDERVKILVFAWETENGSVDASVDQKEIPGKIFTEYEFVFRKPNYADSHKVLQKISQGSTPTGVSMEGVLSIQDEALRSLLIEVKTGEEVIGITATNVNALHPSIARAAISGLLERINF